MSIIETNTPAGCHRPPANRPESLDDELAWLTDVLGISPGGATIDYLGRGSTDELRLLVPTKPPAASAAALRRFGDDRSIAERAAGGAGRALARAGLLAKAPGQNLVLPQFEVVEHLGRRLGQPGLLAAVTLGPRRRNRKPVLQLLTPAGHVVGFAKIGWSPLSRQLVSTEAELLRLVEGRLPNSVITPRVIHHETWNDREIVVVTSLRPPPRSKGRAPSANELVMSIAAADDLGRQPVGSLAIIDEWRAIALHETTPLDDVVDRHRSVVLPLGLWHGDFTPWNVLTRGTSVLLWDWEFGGRGRPIGFDALHHRFEQLRRVRTETNGSALQAVVDDVAGVLAPLGLGLDVHQQQAILDLYLCELIAREIRLGGQRWNGGDLARLGPEADDLLRRRGD